MLEIQKEKTTHLLPKCGMAAFNTASIIPKRLFFAKSFHISIRSSDFSYCREMHIINNSNNVTQIEAYHIEILSENIFVPFS